jgi:hypothetical protein
MLLHTSSRFFVASGFAQLPLLPLVPSRDTIEVPVFDRVEAPYVLLDLFLHRWCRWAFGR